MKTLPQLSGLVRLACLVTLLALLGTANVATADAQTRKSETQRESSPAHPAKSQPQKDNQTEVRPVDPTTNRTPPVAASCAQVNARRWWFEQSWESLSTPTAPDWESWATTLVGDTDTDVVMAADEPTFSVNTTWIQFSSNFPTPMRPMTGISAYDSPTGEGFWGWSNLNANVLIGEANNQYAGTRHRSEGEYTLLFEVFDDAVFHIDVTEFEANAFGGNWMPTPQLPEITITPFGDPSVVATQPTHSIPGAHELWLWLTPGLYRYDVAVRARRAVEPVVPPTVENYRESVSTRIDFDIYCS